MFNKETRPRTKGKYRLMILDWRRSHASAEFDQFCPENHIIALYMPPHSSHLLRPLDVGGFSPLKAVYGRQVENQMRLGINHIDKEEFLALYPAVHLQALNENNIKSGFRAAGLIPYDPDQVLSRLNTTMRTPTPPGTSHSSQASSVTATPHNLPAVSPLTPPSVPLRRPVGLDTPCLSVASNSCGQRSSRARSLTAPPEPSAEFRCWHSLAQLEKTQRELRENIKVV
ncbi:hypothetical protein VTO42DRAFT_4601 [Malbranchea cinnamomea]